MKMKTQLLGGFPPTDLVNEIHMRNLRVQDGISCQHEQFINKWALSLCPRFYEDPKNKIIEGINSFDPAYNI